MRALLKGKETHVRNELSIKGMQIQESRTELIGWVLAFLPPWIVGRSWRLHVVLIVPSLPIPIHSRTLSSSSTSTIVTIVLHWIQSQKALNQMAQICKDQSLTSPVKNPIWVKSEIQISTTKIATFFFLEKKIIVITNKCLLHCT